MAGQKRDLYLQVSGNVTGLQQATKAGKSVLAEFGTAAINTLDEVEKAFADLGANPSGAKALEQAYASTFKRIEDQARAVTLAPNSNAAIQILDANATREAASAATAKAASLRILAEAASRADAVTADATAGTRAYAVATATAAVQAENEAQALREQAQVLGLVEQQLGGLNSAHARTTQISGQAKAGYQQLSYQLGDVATQYAAGTSATIIFAQQSGQVIQALSLVTGNAKGFLGVLGGPWGIAISSALVVLTPWVGKLIEGDDALQKESDSLKKNAASAAVADQAKQAFLRTEAGAIDDVRALTDELKKQNDALKTNAERMNIRAKTRVQTLGDDLVDVAGELDSARRGLAALRQPGMSAERGNGAAIAAAEKQVKDLEARQSRVNTAYAQGKAALAQTRADLAAEEAKRANDPIAQIDRKYDGSDGLIAKAQQRAIAEKMTVGELTRQLTLYEAQRAAEKKAANDRAAKANSKTDPNRQFGREVTVAEATSIVAGIGGRVTSGQRSTAKQEKLYADFLAGRHDGPVAKPGTSAHERGGAIDVAFGAGISVSSIKEAFAKEGVALRKILTEPGQRVFHVEFGKQGPKAKTAEAIARSEQTEKNKAVGNAEAYDQLLTRAQQEELKLRREHTTNIASAAQLDVQSVLLEQARLDDVAQAGVEQKRWTQVQADAVKITNERNAGLKTAAIIQHQVDATLDRQLEADLIALGVANEKLSVDADLATTLKQRRAIALQILANEEAEARAGAKRKLESGDERVRAQGQRDLDRIDYEHPARVDGVNQSTEDPLAAYGRQLTKTTSDMDTALRGVKLTGVKALEDGLVDVITGTESVAGAFKKMASAIIADLARIAVQKLLVNALGKSFFAMPFADGGLVPGPGSKYADGGLPGFASGGQPFLENGIIRGPGTGRSDSILAMVGGRKPIMISNGEGIVNERAVQRYWPAIDAMNKGIFPAFADGGLVAPRSFVPRMPSISAAESSLYGDRQSAGGTITVRVSLSEDLHATIDSRAAGVAVQVVRETAPAIVDAATTSTMAQIRRPSL